MSNEDPPPGGLSLRQALETFPPDDVRETWLRADQQWRAAGSPRRRILSPGIRGWSSEEVRRREISAGELKDARDGAFKGLVRSLWQQLAAGEIVAYGREETPWGPWRKIPQDAWRVLSPKNWDGGIVAYGQSGGDQLHGVRVFPNEEVPPDHRTVDTVAADPTVNECKRRGRTPGSGGYKAADALLVAEMHEMRKANPDLSVLAAATALMHRAAGTGTPESKRDRLRTRYTETHGGQ